MMSPSIGAIVTDQNMNPGTPEVSATDFISGGAQELEASAEEHCWDEDVLSSVWLSAVVRIGILNRVYDCPNKDTGYVLSVK